MILPKTLKNQLNDDLFIGIEAILIYLRCVEVLASLVVKFELPFQGLPEGSHARSLENPEVDRFKMMEGLLIKKEHLPIGMGPEGQPTHGQTTASGASKGKKEEAYIREGLHIEILADDLEALYYGPTICM